MRAVPRGSCERGLTEVNAAHATARRPSSTSAGCTFLPTGRAPPWCAAHGVLSGKRTPAE